MATQKHMNLLISATTALFLGACAQGTGLYANTMSMDAQAKPQGQLQSEGQTASPANPLTVFLTYRRPRAPAWI